MFDYLKEFEQTLQISRVKDIKNENLTDDMINEKYQKGEVRIITEQARYPLSQIREMMESSDYIMHPEFQRRLRWKQDKQSRLIESFIMNIPIPPIFLYECDYSKYEVMDGLQRLTAITDYYNDKYALEGLETWPELNGKKYSELPDQVRKGIDRRYLSSIILLKETAKSKEEAERMKQIVFARINSGGAKLEDQESRNAQINGRFNEMLISLARNNYFCEIFEIPLKTENEDVINGTISEELRNCDFFRKMKDVETVLRFFAFRAKDQWQNETLSKFLDSYCFSMKDASDEVLTDCEELFKRTIKLAFEIFEDRCFSMWKRLKDLDKYYWTNKPAMFLYDCIMYSLSNYLTKGDTLIQNKEAVINEMKEMFIQDNDLFSGRNTSKTYLEKRIGKFDQLFEKYAKDIII